MADRSLVIIQTLARLTCNKLQHTSETAQKTRETLPQFKAAPCTSLPSVSRYCLSNVVVFCSNEGILCSERFRLREVVGRLASDGEG